MLAKCLILILITSATTYGNYYGLDDVSFEPLLKKFDVALVMLYRTSWSSRNVALIDEFQRAALLLYNEAPHIAMAMVDCSSENTGRVCKKYGSPKVPALPAWKLFYGDKFVKDYDGIFTFANDMVDYMKELAGPALKHIETYEDFVEFIEYSKRVVGFFENPDSPLSSVYRSVAKKMKHKYRFAIVTNKSILDKVRHYNNIAIYRARMQLTGLDKCKAVYTGKESANEIIEFLKRNSHGLIGIRELNNESDFDGVPLIVVYYHPAADYPHVRFDRSEEVSRATKRLRERLVNVARKFPEYRFAVSPGADFREELQQLDVHYVGEIAGKDLVVVARGANDRKYVLQGEGKFSEETFEAFVEDLRAGRLTPVLKSEEIPWRKEKGGVRVVVAKNFDKVVNGNGVDTVIAFYSKWQGNKEYEKLEPVLRQLAEKLNDEDVAIMKMNALANDVPSIYNVETLPALFWVPRDAKDSPVKYVGRRKLDDLIAYIAKHSTEPLKGYDREGTPVKASQDEL